MRRPLAALLPAAAACATLAAQVGGSAVITGVVTDASGAAVQGADVSAVDEADEVARQKARTDARGRFSLTNLPPGRFVAIAVAEGFLASAYGAMAPGAPGVPVRLEPGARVEDLHIILDRPASVSGRIANRDGEAVPSAVHALAASWAGGETTLRRVTSARTDAAGGYALSGLPPDPYVILATPFEPGETGGRDDVGAYAPTFHPGVPAAAQAARVTVRPGGDVYGVDVVMHAADLVSVHVTLSGRGQDPIAYPAALLVPEGTAGASLLVDTSPEARALTFARVPAGRYTLIASAIQPDSAGSLTRLWAVRDIDVDGRRPLDLAVNLTPGGRLTGRVVAHGTGAPERPITFLRPFGDEWPQGLLPYGGTPATGRDGRFTIDGIAPGRYILQSGRDAGGQASWSVARVIVGGQDVADLPIDVFPGSDIGDVEVVLSGRLGELAGTLSDSSGNPRFDVTLVAFPADSRYWWTGTRRLRLARPDTAGYFQIGGLPPGDYLVGAVTGHLPPDPADPQWLAGLQASAVPVKIAAGARTVQNLRVGGRVAN